MSARHQRIAQGSISRGNLQNGVKTLEDLEMVFRDVAAGFFVSLGRPVKVGELELEGAALLGEGLEDSDSGPYDLGSDTVARNGGDLVDWLLDGGWEGGCRVTGVAGGGDVGEGSNGHDSWEGEVVRWKDGERR